MGEPVIFGISGYKNSGKTYLMEKVIQGLTKKGWKVVSVKHDGHDFEADREGTDSFRHYHAGAFASIVYSSEKIQVVKNKKNIRLQEIISFFQEADIILIEGGKNLDYPKYICAYPEKLPDENKIIDMIEQLIFKERKKTMNIEKLMEEIHLPEEGRECVRTFKMTREFYKSWKELFYKDKKEFFAEIENRKDKEQLLLYLYIKFAVEQYPEFVKNNISDQIYFDTFYDFTIWFKQCKKKTGKAGLMEERWLSLPLDMKIFRLGRLQFEKDPEKKILHVHIPEGESLSEEACTESFQQAEQFFGDTYEMFDCESWLLSPKLKELLDEDSSIIKFQNRFEIKDIIYTFRQAEERVFGEIREDREHYPEKTRLQRSLKRFVLEGKDVGMGYGIINRKNE